MDKVEAAGELRRKIVVYRSLFAAFALCVLIEGVFISYLLNLSKTERSAYGSTINSREQEITELSKQLEVYSSELSHVNRSTCAAVPQVEPLSCRSGLAPGDRIAEDDISVYPQRAVIDVKQGSLGILKATGSMAPTFDQSSHLLQIVPTSADELTVGDIIAYATPDEITLTVHRIAALGKDEQGWFAITKGDHYSIKDPNPVRFAAVKYVVVGILY